MTDRIRRPPLDRTAPIRNWTTLFGVPTPGAASGANGDAAGATSGERDPSHSSAPPHGFEDVVARSVGLGYRVIDEYIQQGRNVARGFGGRSYGDLGTMTDAQGAAVRMMQYATEMTSLWMQVAGLAAGGMNGGFAAAPGGAPAASAAAAPLHPTAHAAVSNGTRARVRVASTQPVEVAVDFRPESHHGPIVAHALRSATGPGPRIEDVAVDLAEDGTLAIRIRVPDAHPSGRYEGALVEQSTGRSAGWITVRVGE